MQSARALRPVFDQQLRNPAGPGHWPRHCCCPAQRLPCISFLDAELHRPEERMERETRIELATNSLEGCDSTIELLPRLFEAFLILTTRQAAGQSSLWLGDELWRVSAMADGGPARTRASAPHGRWFRLALGQDGLRRMAERRRVSSMRRIVLRGARRPPALLRRGRGVRFDQPRCHRAPMVFVQPHQFPAAFPDCLVAFVLPEEPRVILFRAPLDEGNQRPAFERRNGSALECFRVSAHRRPRSRSPSGR